LTIKLTLHVAGDKPPPAGHSERSEESAPVLQIQIPRPGDTPGLGMTPDKCLPLRLLRKPIFVFRISVFGICEKQARLSTLRYSSRTCGLRPDSLGTYASLIQLSKNFRSDPVGAFRIAATTAARRLRKCSLLSQRPFTRPRPAGSRRYKIKNPASSAGRNPP